MRTVIYMGLMAVVLSGCALKQAPDQADTLALALPPTTQIPATWRANPAASAVEDNWISLFNDPALEAIVAEAITYNLDLRMAVERVRISQQNVVMSGAKLLPQVNAQLGGSTLRDMDLNSNFNSTKAYVGASWELDVWGRVRAQRSAAQAASQATELDFAYARQSLAAQVAISWYLVIETRELVSLADNAVGIYERLLKLVNVRKTAGKDSNLSVVDISASLDAAKADLESMRQSHEQAQRSLEVLLGRYPAAEIKVASDYPQLPPTPGADVPATLLERRPDIVAGERRVLAAFRITEAASLARLPGFSLSIGGGRLGDQLLSLLQLNPWMASAGIGMSVPIFEGGALRAQEEIATAQQAQAVAAYGRAVLNAFSEVENALASDNYIAQQRVYVESELKNRTAAVEIATKQYLAGSQDLLWVARLQAQQIASSSSAVRLRASQGLNRVQLYLALGGSFDAESLHADVNTETINY